ncbi:MAG TPA: GGDEF domain-containing protein [Thermoanaerobaculia bacterium]|jgi:diguanylate cyclase (GGDEF)-like protein
MIIRVLLRAALCASLSLSALAQSPKTLLEEAERVREKEPERAMKLVEQALRDPGLRIEALAMQCSWMLDDNPDAVVKLADAALVEARKANDPSVLSSLHVCRGYGYEYAGRSELARADYEIAVREGRRSPKRSNLAQALRLRGEMDYYRGAFGDALTDLQEAYQLYVALGNRKQQNQTLTAIANFYADARVGQYDRAIEYYRQVLAAHEAERSLSGISTGHYNLGSTFERKGDLPAALEHFRKSLAIEQQRGDREEIAYGQRSVAIILTKMGRAGEALPILDQALGWFEGRNPDRTAMTRLSRGVTLNRLRRFDEALRDLEVARVHYEKQDNARFLEKVHEERALAYESKGDWRRAFEARTGQIALERRLATQLREEQTSRLRVQFDAQKKETENRALLRERENAERIRSLQTVVIILGGAMIAILIWMIVRSLLKARRLRAMAMTDELTRLPNRRALLLFAEEQLKRKQTFCLVAFDIDHFKRVNDTYGHDVGDEVLRRVADTCRGALRRDDRLGRTGGEEFIAVLPRTTAAVAMEVAERLRDAVASSDGTPNVTISLGVSEWTENDSFATLSKRADESLYRAKEGGRNRVELAVA